MATGFILLKPGLACDVVGKEQPRGEGGMKFWELGRSLGTGCSRGDLAVSLPWGQPPAFPRLCSIPFAPAGKGRFGFRGSIPIFCWAPQHCSLQVCRIQVLAGRGGDGFPNVWSRVPSPGAAAASRQRRDLHQLHQNPTRVGSPTVPPRTQQGLGLQPLLTLEGASSGLNLVFYRRTPFLVL